MQKTRSPVILRCAQDLQPQRANHSATRSFAALRMTCGGGLAIACHRESTAVKTVEIDRLSMPHARICTHYPLNMCIFSNIVMGNRQISLHPTHAQAGKEVLHSCAALLASSLNIKKAL